LLSDRVPLSERVVEVLADLGEGGEPRWRVGSGCVVAGRTVLTAAHVVAGAVEVWVRDPGKVCHSAVVDPALCGDAGGPGPDLALVQITDPTVAELPPMGLAAVDRDSPGGESIEQCQVVGYPWFMERPGAAGGRVRDTAAVAGRVPVLSGLAGGLLAVEVKTPPQPLPPGQIALGDSVWAGMSGAPVIAGELLMAVVTEHAPRAGPSAITATPLTALEPNPAHPLWGPGVADPQAWWARLGVPGIQALQKLPSRGRVLTGRPGWPLEEVNDPFALEVHRPVQLNAPDARLPVLPVYVPREHDTALGKVVAAAAGGSSGIAVLVGGSSTGKTRACWEALSLLRGRQPGWRLWHPIEPSRPDAALRDLPSIAPWTVVWLNEAQFYLDAPDGLGERVAAGLRELLRDPPRGPVLVLATLWPQFWGELAVHGSGENRHDHARELLAGHDILVPAAFRNAELQQLKQAGDVRLDTAAAKAQDGQVIQFLAGVPELLARYRNAPPGPAALMDAAIDGRRLGMRVALPQTFLEAAARGYISDSEWDQLDEHWLEQALAYASAPCKGVSGPLMPLKPHSAHPGDAFPGQAGQPGQPVYRLADYLDQAGRRAFYEAVPPPSFWAAAADHAHPDDLATLGKAAYDRGCYRDATRLYKRAAVAGDLRAAGQLVRIFHRMHPDDRRPARWAVASPISCDDPGALAYLLRILHRAGAAEQIDTVLARDPADHVPLDNPNAIVELVQVLNDVGGRKQALKLATFAAFYLPLHDPYAVIKLLRILGQAGARVRVGKLAGRVAADLTIDSSLPLAQMVQAIAEAGARKQAARLADRIAAHLSIDTSLPVLMQLLLALEKAGVREQAYALADRAAASIPLDNPDSLSHLLHVFDLAGAQDQAHALADRAAAYVRGLGDPAAVLYLLAASRKECPVFLMETLLARDPGAHIPLDDSAAVARLLRLLRESGVQGQIATLMARNPAVHVPLDYPGGVVQLLRVLQEMGALEQATTLADRAAAEIPLDDPAMVVYLLRELQRAQAPELIATLLDRNPATHAASKFLEDFSLSEGPADLLQVLQEAGAQEQVTTLASRIATHCPLDYPSGVAQVLQTLQGAGAEEQAATLADRAAHMPFDRLTPLDDWGLGELVLAINETAAQESLETLIHRLPGAGRFETFRELTDRQERFRYGVASDGSPAEQWSWEDLD
jgi:hypothetical protein